MIKCFKWHLALGVSRMKTKAAKCGTGSCFSSSGVRKGVCGYQRPATAWRHPQLCESEVTITGLATNHMLAHNQHRLISGHVGFWCKAQEVSQCLLELNRGQEGGRPTGMHWKPVCPLLQIKPRPETHRKDATKDKETPVCGPPKGTTNLQTSAQWLVSLLEFKKPSRNNVGLAKQPSIHI